MQRFFKEAKHFKVNKISVKIMLYYFDITVIVRLQLDIIIIIIITISLFCTISYFYR